MSINKILNSLDKSWDRDEILLKIKNGLCTDEIINQFLVNNKDQIKELNTLLRPEDIDLLNQFQQLAACESKLIHKINNLNSFKIKKNNYKLNEKKISISNGVPNYKISSFMIKWSNKFVVIALLTISAIALSKQAWA